MISIKRQFNSVNKSSSLSRISIWKLSISLLCFAIASLQSVQCQSLSATPAPSQSDAGSTLSPTLGPSFAGVGIEPTNLFDYLGTENYNVITFNCLSNLANYTGVPPHIRIGGNSGDNMIFDNSSQYSGYQIYNNPNPTGVGYSIKSDSYIIGTAYYQIWNYLPKGTPVTYGLNMAYQESDYLTQLVDQANAPFEILTNATLVGFEVGNEPDLYIQNGYRSSGWTASNYGSEWATRVETIYPAVLQQRNLPSNFFEPPATATTATSSGQQYRISNLINTNIAIQNGIYVAGWNQHDYYYYVNVSDYTLTLSILMDLSTLVKQLTEWKGQAAQAQVTGKPYYLREFGSVGPTGLQGITNVFGNALWTLNAFLYCATIQMSSVQMHMTSNSVGSPWQPIPFNGEQPHVRSSYYAFAAVAQIIGKGCTTRVAQVSVNNVPSSYSNNVALYSVYQFGALRSLVMINTKPAYTGQSAGTMNFQLSLPSLAGQTLYLSTLTASGVDAEFNTTWNGISYEQTDDGRATTINSNVETVTIDSSGSVSIPVRDSQAIVAALNSVLGAEQNVDTSACESLATNPEGGENTGKTQTAGITSTAPVFGASSAPTFKSTGGFIDSSLNTFLISSTTMTILFIIPGFVCIFIQFINLI